MTDTGVMLAVNTGLSGKAARIASICAWWREGSNRVRMRHWAAARAVRGSRKGPRGKR